MASYRFLSERNFRYFCQGLTLDSKDMEVLDSALVGLDEKTKCSGRIVAHNARNGFGPPMPIQGPQVIVELNRYKLKDSRDLSTAKVVQHQHIPGKQPALHINLCSVSLDIPQRIEVPLRYLLKGMPALEGSHMVYLHALKMQNPTTQDGSGPSLLRHH